MKKFLFASILIFILLSITLGLTYNHWGDFSGWHTTGDYAFHWGRANDDCPMPLYPVYTCEGYRPLYQFITRVFANQEFLFNLFPLIVLVFLIPYLIYSKTKSHWSLLNYYSSVFIFHILFASIFPQMLLTVFFVMMVYKEKFDLISDGFLLLLGSLTHSTGLFVLLPVVFYKLFSKKIDHFFSSVFPLFFPPFALPNIDPSYLLFLGVPINWFYSMKLSVSKCLLILVFVFGAFEADYRSLLFLPILWSLWLPEILEKESKRTKIVIAFLYLLWTIFQFLYFFRLINPVVPIP